MYVLTQNKAHEFVGQDAGGDKGHPQTNVQLLSDLRLHPHEQTATHTSPTEKLHILPISTSMRRLKMLQMYVFL